MCLKVTKSFNKLERHLPVWKVGYTSYSDRMYKSPYRFVKMPFNQLYNDPLFINHFEDIIGVEINEGYIHSFTDYNTAKDAAFLMNCEIFEAFIPSDAVGYFGNHDDVCSNKIVILDPSLLGFKEIMEEYGFKTNFTLIN